VWETVQQIAPLGPNSEPKGKEWKELFADCHLNDAGYQAGYDQPVNTGDGRRKQFAVPKKANNPRKDENEKKRKVAREKLYTFLLQVLTCSCFGWLNEDEELEVKEVNILYSGPQCQEQRKHHDLPFQFGDPSSKFGRWYSAIIPLRQPGGLVVWPGSHHHVRAGDSAHNDVYQSDEEINMAQDDGREISHAWQKYREDPHSKGMTPPYEVVQRKEIVAGSENCIVFDSLLLHAGAESLRRAGQGSYRLHAYFRVGKKGDASLNKPENSTINVNKFAWRATSSCGCRSCRPQCRSCRPQC
jgi:hypothetical protein